MKFVGVIGCAMLIAAGSGGAHAQGAACTELPQLLLLNEAQVKGLQGAQIEQDEDQITYTPKKPLPGFSGCKLMASKQVDSISDYLDHHLWCAGESADSNAADAFVEGLWACTKDAYVERASTEALIGGRYRVIGFEGETPIAGKAAGLVDFGVTDYARVVLEKSYDTSNDYNLHIYWSFAQ